MVAIVSAVVCGGGKGDLAPIASTNPGPVSNVKCRLPKTSSRSFRVRILILRSLPQASASLRATSGISPRATIVLRVGIFGDKLSNVDTFSGWTKMTLRSEWLALCGLGFESARVNNRLVCNQATLHVLLMQS